MNDETAEEEHFRAKSFVLDILLVQTMADICMLSDNPILEAQRKAARLFDGLDHATDANVESEWFNHFALDEMEIFWKRVKREIEYQLKNARKLMGDDEKA